MSLGGDLEFDPAGAHPLPLFRSAVFSSSGDRIDALTEGAFVIPEPGTAQLLLLAAGVFSLTALIKSEVALRGLPDQRPVRSKRFTSSRR